MSKDKVEETGGEFSSAPNDKYQKFFDKFSEIDTLEVKDWKIAHLLGYFCKKYKETYKVDYTWKFNNPNPNKCFEVWQMNVMGSKLSQNPQILKNYIDWGFENLVPKAKRRLTSISFLTREEELISYKMNVLLGGKKNLEINRSSMLPPHYQACFKNASTTIKTYGDLAFVCQMEPMPADLAAAVQEMKNQGFDMEVLKRVV